MAGPLVGITLGLDREGRLRPGRRTHYLDASYARAVREAGGTPVYLPHEGPAVELAERLDGLLLPGGDDFLPETPYPPEVRFTPAAPEQLTLDAAVLAAARARAIPVLGICYGMQLLARESGGALLYHLPMDHPGALEHQARDPEQRHAVILEATSRLADILGTTRTWVNSRHHQGVARPGQGLAVCARAEDELIEAIESPGDTFVLGVQWHPESLEAEHRARLFGAFVAACRSAV